jgi:hypothetical protein
MNRVEFDNTIDEGIRRAWIRCRLDGPEGNRAQLDRALTDAHRLLTGSSLFAETSEWSARGVVLLAELVAVGVYARAINDEKQLDAAQVNELPDWLKKIINDWHKD